MSRMSIKYNLDAQESETSTKKFSSAGPPLDAPCIECEKKYCIAQERKVLIPHLPPLAVSVKLLLIEFKLLRCTQKKNMNNSQLSSPLCSATMFD